MTLPTDSESVALMAALYADQPHGFDHVETTAGIVWGVVRRGKSIHFTCRGSKSFQDWERDAESELGRHLPGYPQLGLMPDGFSIGVVETAKAMQAFVEPGDEISGGAHSLGASHLVEIVGVFVEDGLSFTRLVLCGCPRPGTALLWAALTRTQIIAFDNRNDRVCLVPEPVPFVLPWKGPNEIALNVPPPAGDPLNPDPQHSIVLYAQGVAAYEVAQSAS